MKTVLPYDQVLKVAFDHDMSHRYAQAEPLYRQLLARRADDEFVNDSLIRVLYMQGKFEEAMAIYDVAVHRGFFPCDSGFDKIYARALAATGNCPSPLKRRHRFHTLLELLSRSFPLEGESAECGCYRGMSSYLMCSRLRQQEPSFSGKTYHIFDSFQGLSAPTFDDDVPDDHPNAQSLRIMTTAGFFSAPLSTVKQNLQEFPDIAFHPGWIPFCFWGLPDSRYRFVHLDVDLYDPTLESLEYFHPRMARGGIIVSDDYGWPGARRAIDEFCAERGIALSVTKNEQAVIIV